jgi:capsular exopolysaccharide synthesis family protein
MMYPGNSILDEIRRLHEERQNGTLTLTGSGGERLDVFFREGMIEAAASSSGSGRLGDYLVKMSDVSAAKLSSVQEEAANRNISFGEAVVLKKLADRIQVGAAVRSQALELLEHAVRNDFSIDTFNTRLRGYFAPARITFQQVLLQLARSNSAPLDLSGETLVALVPNVDLSVFPWLPEEICVLKELRYLNTLRGVSSSTGLKSEALNKILGTLSSLGIIETGEACENWMTENSVVVRKTEFAFEHLIPSVPNAVVSERIPVAASALSFTSEQFKNLKVQLRQIIAERPLKVFTVSSPEPQDGKSLVSINLAFSFAMDPGRRVIIVDCDLRNPSLGEYLGVPSEPGLLQYMENVSLGPYCFVRRFGNLYFMTSGGVAKNPIEILSMQKMQQMIERLKEDFDTIVLDAPPYAPLADARVVTEFSDGVLMVIRRGKTSYAATDRAIKAVDRNKLVGVVFNDVKAMPFHTYHTFGQYEYSRKEIDHGDSGKLKDRLKNLIGS